MTHLVHQLGISSSLSFHDVYSIDEPEIIAFVPRPAFALLLVFPVSKSYEKFREEEDSDKPVYEGSGEGESVVWFKQTIRNACGLIGLLHGVSNGGAKEFIAADSDLSTLLKQAIPLKPDARANLLYESRALESAHQSAASKGDTVAPDANAKVDLHFVCFVKENGHLWELDGRRKGPIDRGTLREEDDALSEKALELGVRNFLTREASGADSRFSLVALSKSWD
jgi:ubiquitin carboxyl-terminal hydrolase L3